MVNFPEITKSRLRQKLLGYFFTNPQVSLYLREVSGILKEDAGNLSKELSRLEKDGIFSSKIRGRQKYFSLNRDYPLFQELKSVIFKTIGIEGSIKELVAKIEGIKSAFIYGSFAEDKETAVSDIDLLIIGSPDSDKLMQEIEILEQKLQRQINYNIYPEEEFKRKAKLRDSFITNVLNRPKIMIKGAIGGI